MSSTAKEEGLQGSNPLSKKLNKILETRFDNDKELLESLKSLSQFFNENNLRSRRNLRSDIERRSLSINEEFVEAFSGVIQQLDDVYGAVKAVSECCDDMTTRLKNAKEQTHDLIDQTNQLQAENQRMALRAQIADAFLAKFQLKPAEVHHLQGLKDGSISQEFFSALERVKEIHSDCKILLRTNHQTAGLEIMESMALHQETSYERLYRWTQSECRLLTGDSPDCPPLLCQAFQALQDRPVLARYALDEFGTARRTAIVRAFIDALTRGGPGGTPRPIELHSHDPVRYVGDMLAWIHQASASEKEHLKSLLKLCTGQVVDQWINSTLGHITEGVARPLKVRVEQVFVSDPVVLYRLTCHLAFYKQTLRQLFSVEEETALSLCLGELEALGAGQFQGALQAHGQRLLEKQEGAPPTLGPPQSLRASLSLLGELFSTPLPPNPTDMSKVLASVLEPATKMWHLAASHLSPIDAAVFELNCVGQVISALAVYEFSEPLLEQYKLQLQTPEQTLLFEQFHAVLGYTGLKPLFTVLQESQNTTEIANALDDDSVQHISAKLDQFLASPDRAVLPQCSMITQTIVRDRIVRASLESFCTFYQQLYPALSQACARTGLSSRTPQQLTSLLIN